MVRSTRRVADPGSEFAGFRFPPEVITLAVRWYLRFGLSYRDVEELLAERGIEVDHTTLFRWVVRFTPLFVEAARPCRLTPGDRWFVDETYVKVDGRWSVAVPLSLRIVATGHAFVQNLPRGHYELATEAAVLDRVPVAFTELALAI